MKLDYEAVNLYKLEYLRLLFHQMGEKLLESTDFRLFFKENRQWLIPYSVFCYLRDKYGTSVFRNWPEHQVYHEETISRMAEEDQECHQEVRFHYFLQYILHVQLRAASEYARSKGILLKGDIPIGVSPNSVEAWTEPYYFPQRTSGRSTRSFLRDWAKLGIANIRLGYYATGWL